VMHSKDRREECARIPEKMSDHALNARQAVWNVAVGRTFSSGLARNSENP
jgi:hypothetical protein